MFERKSFKKAQLQQEIEAAIQETPRSPSESLLRNRSSTVRRDIMLLVVLSFRWDVKLSSDNLQSLNIPWHFSQEYMC